MVEAKTDLPSQNIEGTAKKDVVKEPYPDSRRPADTPIDFPVFNELEQSPELNQIPTDSTRPIDYGEVGIKVPTVDLDNTNIVRYADSERSNDFSGNTSSKSDNSESKSFGNSGIESENKTRELTDEEKNKLKEVLGWSDKQLSKCTIDENGVIHYKTDRSDLEGKTSENGIPYERKQININGVIIEGVFPKFESVYTTYLSEDTQKSNTYAKECNSKLKEAIQNDPELRSMFTPEQLNDIENDRTPTGYVWHHNEEQGKMELVERSAHDKTIGGAAHTGGSALWGPDSVDKSQKGESF